MPHGSSADRRGLRLTFKQHKYLEELIADDIEGTELTQQERDQATSALKKVKENLERFPPR